jgi:hypothetical protein
MPPSALLDRPSLKLLQVPQASTAFSGVSIDLAVLFKA